MIFDTYGLKIEGFPPVFSCSILSHKSCAYALTLSRGEKTFSFGWFIESGSWTDISCDVPEWARRHGTVLRFGNNDPGNTIKEHIVVKPWWAFWRRR